MTNEEILTNAPEHCFAVDHFIGSKEPVYICSNSNEFYAVHSGEKIGTAPNKYPFSVRFRSLSDIRRIVELEKEVKKWQKWHLETSQTLSEVCGKAEAAERERDDMKANIDHLMKDCHRFTDKRLNEFAIEQRISGIQRVLDCRELNLSEGDVATISLMQEQLRQQLNGGAHE